MQYRLWNTPLELREGGGGGLKILTQINSRAIVYSSSIQLLVIGYYVALIIIILAIIF